MWYTVQEKELEEASAIFYLYCLSLGHAIDIKIILYFSIPVKKDLIENHNSLQQNKNHSCKMITNLMIVLQ